MTNNLNLANGDSQEYWEGARKGQLLIQKCRSCHTFQFPPRHHCAACWEGDLEWTQSAGVGSIESFTIVRRAPLPAYREKVPYVVAAVRLDEGPRMITNLVGKDALSVGIGDSVKIEFQASETGDVLPQFRRT